MNRKLLFLLIFTLPFMIFAQDVKVRDVSGDVTVQGVVGYNTTWKWHSGGDIKGALHLKNTDIHLDLESLTSNVHSVGATVTPYFDVCKDGQIFLDGTLHSRIFSRNKAYEFVYSGSVGFRMRHFSVQAGVFARIMDAIGRDWHSVDNYIVEPFNVLYRIAVSIKGFDNPWDIYFIGADYSEFEYERVWQPIFTMGGRAKISERLNIVAEGTLKPAGMFHGTAAFYAAWLKVGVNYKLK